jgi:nucleotide-binding universal stress UspA family protein
VSSKSLSKELEEAEIEIEEIAMQLADMLGAALYFAGVKKDKIPDAVEAYLQGLDEIFEDDEDIAEMGFEEVVKVIEYLQDSHKHLFK